MRMSEKSHISKYNNNKSDNPLTSRRTDAGKNSVDLIFRLSVKP